MIERSVHRASSCRTRSCRPPARAPRRRGGRARPALVLADDRSRSVSRGVPRVPPARGPDHDEGRVDLVAYPFPGPAVGPQQRRCEDQPLAGIGAAEQLLRGEVRCPAMVRRSAFERLRIIRDDGSGDGRSASSPGWLSARQDGRHEPSGRPREASGRASVTGSAEAKHPERDSVPARGSVMARTRAREVGKDSASHRTATTRQPHPSRPRGRRTTGGTRTTRRRRAWCCEAVVSVPSVPPSGYGAIDPREPP